MMLETPPGDSHQFHGLGLIITMFAGVDVRTIGHGLLQVLISIII